MQTGFGRKTMELVTAASGQIIRFHYDREVIAPKPAPPKGLLFHYTNADGLRGIIENHELWATSAYFLNDSAEITYGCDLLKDILDEWITDNPRPAESVTLALANDLRKIFGEDLLKMTIIEPIYLMCFCENDNLLSQWRTYGERGGYSLGFRVPAEPFTRQGFTPEPKTYTSKWVKVEYSRREQVKKCKSILDSLLPIFDKRDIAEAVKAADISPLFGYQALRKDITDILLEEVVSFKNQAFEVEEEWRIVVRAREFTKQGIDDGGKTPTPVYFRSSKGVLVPYVKLIPIEPAGKLPIASVRSGPTLERATSRMVINMMLRKSGYSNVVVEGSDISVRF